MKKVLVINTSARTLNSKSRGLTKMFVEYWKQLHPDPTICFRDLGNNGAAHITENWIIASFKPGTERLAEERELLSTSDTYIAELRDADIIVLGAPMYNWSIPSSLKAYIDQVMRVNETFKLNPSDPQHPYTGLLQNKILFLFLSRGYQGYEKGEHNEHMNFQSGYLKTVFSIMGISRIHVVAINGVSLDPGEFAKSLAMAHQTIKALVEKELA